MPPVARVKTKDFRGAPRTCLAFHTGQVSPDGHTAARADLCAVRDVRKRQGGRGRKIQSDLVEPLGRSDPRLVKIGSGWGPAGG